MSEKVYINNGSDVDDVDSGRAAKRARARLSQGG